MDVGAVLSRSLSLYRKNLNLVLPHLIEYALDLLVLLVFGVIAVIVLVSILGSLTIGSVTSILYGPTPFLLIGFVIFAISAIFLSFMLFNAYARAAIIGMAIEAGKDGTTSLNTGIKSAKKHGLGVFGYTLAISVVPVFVIGAIITAVVVVFAIISAGTGGLDTGFVSIAIMIFFASISLAAYIAIYVLALFSPQKIVIEERGMFDGIKASSGFVRKHPTGVVIYIGVAFAVMVVMNLLSLVFTIPKVLFELMDSRFIAMFLQIFEFFFSIAIGLLITPYLETVKTLMVLDEGGTENEVEKPAVL